MQALWWAGKGDWDQAHSCAQSGADRDSDWVHAHLHRQEGDRDNAAYWYRRAGQPFAVVPLEEEWAALVVELLDRT